LGGKPYQKRRRRMTYTAKTAEEFREIKGSLSKKITDELALIDADLDDIRDGIDITGPWSIGGSGDGEGIALTDSSEKALEAYGELPSTGTAITAGEVIYAARNRLLINKAQTNNVSLYGAAGHLRVKTNMAAGVHAGLYGYFEQSGTVTLSSSGSFNAAANLGVEGGASLTVDSGVNLAGCIISSVVNGSATINGNFYGLMIRKASSMTDWSVGINIENSTVGIDTGDDCTTGIDVGDAPTGISFTGTYSTAALQLGTSGSKMNLAAQPDHAIDINTTSPSVDAANSVRPIHMISEMTGIGGVGGRAEFEMTTNVALGGWSNAVKAFANYQASGKTTGLGSAMLAELTLSAGTSDGNYAPMECEINIPSGASLGTKTKFMHLSVQGADVTNMDDSGYLFSLNGLTIGSSKMIQANTDQPTHAIRIDVDGTDYFLLMTNVDNGTE
jgi:hypothetical protein